MVRKQMSKMNSNEFEGDEYKGHSGERRIIRKRLLRESVSPSSFKTCLTGSQNLFERFEMEAMDECAKRNSSSPICKATASTEWSNEDQVVMTAFRSLKGQLKGKARKGCSDFESVNGPSRNRSPGSASRYSPRAHTSSVGLHPECLHHSSVPDNVNGQVFPQQLHSFSPCSSSSSLSNNNHVSSSPMRMSPRKHGDRLGLTKLNGAEKLKTESSSGIVSEVDHRHLSSHSFRTWSTREVPPVSVQEANSPRSLRSRFDLNHPPVSETFAKTQKINPNSGKTKITAFSKISNLPNSKNCVIGKIKVSNKNKTIKQREARKSDDHVACSLNKCSKVAHEDTLTVPVVRQLFIDTETCNMSSPGFKQPNHCSTPLIDNSKEYEADVSMGAERNLLREDGESLLCAMLVGGVEVTKHYEQSRDSQSGGSKSNSYSCDRSKCANSESSNSVFSASHDSFFDEDFSLSEISETKPYELPVLSRLPALKNVNMAVLELTKTETRFSEDNLSEDKKLKGHYKKQQPLLDLISRVKSCVSPSDTSCREADEVLLNVSKDEDDLDCGVGNMVTVVESDLQTLQPSPLEDSNIDMPDNSNVSRDPIEMVKSGILIIAQDINYEKDCAVMTSVSENASTSIVAAKTEGESVLDSPCSLSELDTAQMTEAATQAVKNVMSSSVDGKMGKDNSLCQLFSSVGSTSMCPTTSDNLYHSTSKYSFPSTSTPAHSARGDGVIKTTSQFRTFFNRISSPSKVCWKPKADTSTELNKPRWSKWHSAMEPLPLNILGQFENADSSKWSPFTSRELDSYLRQSGNRHLKPAGKDSQLARFLVDEGFAKSFDELQQQLSGNSELKKVVEEGKAVKSEEEEEGEEDEKDLELARKLDPDFDEVEGLVFVSFPSELGILAHEKVEKELQWDKEISASVHMARFHAFEELRRREGKVRRESQGLRGQHMKWRKYQRLYRFQLQQLYRDQKKDIPSPLEKISEKTSDSHKAKIVKKRLSHGAVTEDIAIELLSEGQERVKRKRKTYVFSSKKKKAKIVVKQEKELVEESNSEAEEEEDDNEEEGYGAPIPLEEDAYMEDVQCSLQEMRLKEKGLKQSRGIFARLNMGPEERHIFKKLGGWVTRYRRFRKLPPGTKPSKSHRIRSKGRTLKAAFEVKTLSAGLVLRALTTLVGEYKSDTFYFNNNVTKIELPDNFLPSPSTTITPSDESKTPYQPCLSLPSAKAILTAPASYTSTSDRGLQPFQALAAERSVKVDSGTQVKTEMDGLVEFASESRPNTKCDKPGCRFGCICHLCLPPADMDSNETELPVASTPVKHGCDKEYCTLGCICDSLESPSSRAVTTSNSTTASADSKSCEDRKTSTNPTDALSLSCCVPSSFHSCVSQSASVKESPVCSVEDSQLLETDIIKAEGSLQSPALSDDGEEHGDSSGDECPTLEKTAPRKQRNADRYSNLPRRQTSYRIAKNLDAVSRKAMMMWEMSEVYSEQMNNRRKKVPDNAVVTFSCSPTTLSPMILSSTSVAFPVSQGNSKMVSTSVSVNTLPLLSLKKPCASGVERPALARLHGLQSCVQKPPSVSSDEEDNANAVIEKLSLGCVAQTKKMNVRESERDVAAQKMHLSQLTASLPLTTSANTSTTTTTTIVSASSVASLDVTASSASVCGPITAVSTTVPATSVTTSSGRIMKPVHTLNTSSSSEVLSSDSGCEWQISLICLKANSSHRHNSSFGDSDDVLEEDEIKLFEFYANCQWERSKKEILMAITNTLKRGLYPEPQVLCVGDFRVEILPKASRPSVIPVELRSKLPNYMYSVRVRVTEIVPPTPKLECSTPAVTASSAAPAQIKGAGSDLLKIVDRLSRVKEGRPSLEEGMNSSAVETSSNSTVPQMSIVATNKFPVSCDSMAGCVTKSDKGMTSSVGISGLGKLRISHSSQSVLPVCSSMQHLQIVQKERTQLGVETKKRKKKKKKKKNHEVGDDFLVPSLSKLTVSPRKIHKNSTTSFPSQLNSSRTLSVCPSRTQAGSLPNKPSIAVSFPSTITRSHSVAQVAMATAQKSTMLSVSPAVAGISGVPGTLNRIGTSAASGPLLAATSSACGQQFSSTAADCSLLAPLPTSSVSALTRLSLPGAVRLPPNVKLLPGVQVISARMMAFRPQGTESHKQFYCIPLPMASLNPALQTQKKVSGVTGDKKSANSVPLNLSQKPPWKGLGTSQAISNVVIDKPDGKLETVTLETLKDQAVKKKKKKKKKEPLQCCTYDKRGDSKVLKPSAIIGDFCKILDSPATPNIDIRVSESSTGYDGDLNLIELSSDSKCASKAKANCGSMLSCKPVTLGSPLPAPFLSPSAISLQVMADSCSGQITKSSTITSQAATSAVLLSSDSTTASATEGRVSAAKQSYSDLISVSE